MPQVGEIVFGLLNGFPELAHGVVQMDVIQDQQSFVLVTLQVLIKLGFKCAVVVRIQQNQRCGQQPWIIEYIAQPVFDMG